MEEGMYTQEMTKPIKRRWQLMASSHSTSYTFDSLSHSPSITLQRCNLEKSFPFSNYDISPRIYPNSGTFPFSKHNVYHWVYRPLGLFFLLGFLYFLFYIFFVWFKPATTPTRYKYKRRRRSNRSPSSSPGETINAGPLRRPRKKLKKFL